MWKLSTYFFASHVIVSALAGLWVTAGTFNDKYMGMSLPIIVTIIGIAACLFLFERVKAEQWVWGLLIGSFASNIFERLLFGSIFDWIPYGIGFCNTADIGIMVSLCFLLRGSYDAAKGGTTKG